MRGRILDAFTDAVDGMCAALDTLFPSKLHDIFLPSAEVTLSFDGVPFSRRPRGGG